MSSYRVGVIVGSLSRSSINGRLARALERLAPQELEFHAIPIGELPLFNRDYDEDGHPEAAQAFKAAVTGSDGVLIVTPEYSRSIPGALKNALDWAARPYGQNAFNGMPTAVTGTSTGGIGTAVAQQHLKTILSNLNAVQFGQPEAFVQSTPGLITEDGEITEQRTEAFLRGFLDAFLALLERHARVTA